MEEWLINANESLLFPTHLPLIPAVPTKPLLGQLLLLHALQVEPLSLAKGIIAHDHLSVRRLPTIAVLRFVRIVLPLSSFLGGVLLVVFIFVGSLLAELVFSFVDASNL